MTLTEYISEFAKFIEPYGEIAKIMESYVPLITAAAIVGSAIGFSPRVGPVRALSVFVKTWVRSSRTPLSIRREDLQLIHSFIDWKDWEQEYIVVTGEKGIGKTCFLEMATNKTGGILNLTVYPKMGEAEIVDNTLRQLTNYNLPFSPV